MPELSEDIRHRYEKMMAFISRLTIEARWRLSSTWDTEIDDEDIVRCPYCDHEILEEL